MKYTIERDTEYHCYVVHQDGAYLPNMYEDRQECLEAILKAEGIEVTNE